MTNRTWLLGQFWWAGFWSVLMATLSNASALNGLRALEPAPSTAKTHHPGRSVFLRSGAVIGPAILLIVGSAANLGVLRTSDNDVGWQVGRCVDIGVVSTHSQTCGPDSDGKIIATAPSANDCPPQADSSVVANGTTYCIEEAAAPSSGFLG